MAGLFCNSPELQRLEKQMRQPPGYRARGHGSIEDMSEWKEMGAYSEIVDYVIDRMHLEYLKKESVRSSIRQRMNSFSMTVTTKKDSIYYGRDRKRIRCRGYRTMQLLFFYFLRMKNCGKNTQADIRYRNLF